MRAGEVCTGLPIASQIMPKTISSNAGNSVPISPEIDPTLANRLPPRNATIVLAQYNTMITAATYTPYCQATHAEHIRQADGDERNLYRIPHHILNPLQPNGEKSDAIAERLTHPHVHATFSRWPIRQPPARSAPGKRPPE